MTNPTSVLYVTDPTEYGMGSPKMQKRLGLKMCLLQLLEKYIISFLKH